ncbi:hypothetical protein GCM10009557_05830 [Virgisporangium ochraceum]|uniref:Uncharacterized protein n=1 Tax=Virgisporangium ochraceum TaxID=65505 RepID=A0A8J3ZQ57_9ACTN|nr:hypothetical protein [Virgisporangium ochraceum]GIJ66240.1 hypothetical protein Voc01_011570 [Virgisporangium ochraceum]
MTIDMRHRIMVAWGSDLRDDPSTWVWSDIHEDVEWAPEYTIKDGRSEGATQAETLSVSPALEVRNPDGRYTPEDARSELWPHVVEGTPLWWTINTGGQDYDLVQGFLSGLTPRWSSRNGRHKVVDMAVFGRLGLLSRGKRPLPSAYRRAVLASAPLAYWELADGSEASEYASALAAGTPLRSATGLLPRPAALAGPAGAPDSVPLLIESAAFTGEIVAPIIGGSATEWTVEGNAYLVAGAGNSFSASVVLARWNTTGTIGVGGWELVGAVAPEDGQISFTVFALDADNSIQEAEGTSFLGTAAWHHWRVSCKQVGANVQVQVWANGDLHDVSTWTGYTLGAITRVRVGADPNDPTVLDPATPGSVMETAALSGLVVHNTATLTNDHGAAASGFTGETPSQRLIRIGREAGFPVTVDPGMTDVVDDFDRTVSPGWGDEPGGKTWTNLGSGGTVSASDWSVAGGSGLHSVPAAAAYRFSYLDVYLGDVEVYAEVTVAAPTGGDLEPTIMLRGTSSVDYYLARAVIAPGGTVQAQLRRLVDNVDTAIETTTVPDLVHDAGQPLKIRAQIIGTRCRMKVWQGDVEPAGWHATETDDNLGGTGFAGVRSGVGTGNSNSKPVVFSWHQVVITDLAVRMGAQPAAKVIEIAQECERTGMGRLSERTWGVHYRPLNTLYNQAPAFELDVAEQQLGDPFTPKRDVTIIRNEVEVSSPLGRVVWVDEESQSRGRFEDTAAINPDTHLAMLLQAQARVAIGTVPGYRYPSLSTDLGRHEELLPAWQALQLGDRMQVHGARRLGHAEDLVDQLVEGRQQKVWGRRSWRVTLFTSPAAPYTVGVIEGLGGLTSPPWRLDATAEITQAYGAGVTSLSVATTEGPLLSTDSSDYPCDVLVDGVPMRITTVSGASSPQTVTVVRGIDGWDRPIQPPSAGPGRGQLRLWRAARTAL